MDGTAVIAHRSRIDAIRRDQPPFRFSPLREGTTDCSFYLGSEPRHRLRSMDYVYSAHRTRTDATT